MLSLIFKYKKTGNNLSSQQGNSQVFSAPMGLTSVFGMGTGISPQVMVTRNSLCTLQYTQKYIDKYLFQGKPSWLSPRFISTGQLHVSLHLHLQPINHIVYMESYYLNDMRYLILGWASHLDAFSVYPFHTQLLSRATGVTTDTPSVCPSWSSRTKDSSLQISCACDR